MNVFDFISEYWWMAFPAFGLATAVYYTFGGGKKVERERHQRKLELMAAKRGEFPPGFLESRTTTPRPAEDATRENVQRLIDEHDEVTGRWLDYELDVAKTIAFPAMSDGREPLTAAFLRAKRVADRLRPVTADVRLTPEQFAEYREAVTDFAVKFDVAEQNARRVRDTGFTEEERRRLERAQQLLKTAVDKSATAAERQVAYRRVREELDGLLVLSDDAVSILETRVGKEITSGPDAAGTTGTGAGATGTGAPGTGATGTANATHTRVPLQPPAAPGTL
jgi:hypothetical protein